MQITLSHTISFLPESQADLKRRTQRIQQRKQRINFQYQEFKREKRKLKIGTG
jgi:hypothetical protein